MNPFENDPVIPVAQPDISDPNPPLAIHESLVQSSEEKRRFPELGQTMAIGSLPFSVPVTNERRYEARIPNAHAVSPVKTLRTDNLNDSQDVNVATPTRAPGKHKNSLNKFGDFLKNSFLVCFHTLISLFVLTSHSSNLLQTQRSSTSGPRAQKKQSSRPLKLYSTLPLKRVSWPIWRSSSSPPQTTFLSKRPTPDGSRPKLSCASSTSGKPVGIFLWSSFYTMLLLSSGSSWQTIRLSSSRESSVTTSTPAILPFRSGT